jgi:phage terminase small subunit
MTMAVTRGGPPDEPEWGPAMMALPNDQQRAFVYHYVRSNPRRGALVAAARRAGYVANSTPTQQAKFAWKLSRDPRVLQAITEESRKILFCAFPEAGNALVNLIRDPDHRDHGRAIAMLLDRTFPAETKHNVEVVHKIVNPDEEALEELRALRHLNTPRDKLLELFGPNGLDRLEMLEAADQARRAAQAKVIDGQIIEG